MLNPAALNHTLATLALALSPEAKARQEAAAAELRREVEAISWRYAHLDQPEYGGTHD